MLNLIERARQVARSDAAVLLQGESGVGKSCFARLIHEQSSRARFPLVEVNCAAIPEALIESEFFGHVRGAFTGAIDNRDGKFAAANHGTLFLDEIGDIPIHLQAKLLDALEEQRFHRLGSNDTVRVDARIISASNIDLRHAVDMRQLSPGSLLPDCGDPAAHSAAARSHRRHSGAGGSFSRKPAGQGRLAKRCRYRRRRGRHC
ncbi:MAG: sigma-54 factor interaction domain-containing protein [Comamonadaceae bacterium]|nr:sigma-54 factor interaction domain-containing protein [Comamonadaceae bacterium]